MNKISTNTLKVIFLYIFAFVLMYQPDLSYYIKINGLIIYTLFLFIYLSKYMRKRDYRIIKYFKMKPIFFFSLLNILFTIYYLVRTTIAGTELSDFMNLRIIQNLMPIYLLLGALVINIELDDMKFSKDKKYQFIINVALIQSLIAISMIFVPSLRNIAYNIFYKGNSEINVYISSGRLYGICDGNYTYSFQVLSSYLALFTLYYAFSSKQKKYYIYSLLILLTSILNGRTGLMIFAVGFIFLIIREFLFKFKLVSLTKILLVSIIVSIIGWVVISKYAPGTASLLTHAFNDILGYLKGTSSDTETGYLVNMLNYPVGTINKIFGAGYRIYGHAGVSYGYPLSSDIGFINDWFMAGIFTLLFLYNSFITLLKKISYYSKKNSFEKNIVYVTIIYIFMANIKGEIFRSQIQIAVILCVLITLLLEVINEKNINSNTSV